MSFQESDRAQSLNPSLTTSSEAYKNWQDWHKAGEAIQFGNSYSIGDRTVTREDSAEVRYWANYWAREYKALYARERGSAGAGYRVADFRYGPV